MLHRWLTGSQTSPGPPRSCGTPRGVQRIDLAGKPPSAPMRGLPGLLGVADTNGSTLMNPIDLDLGVLHVHLVRDLGKQGRKIGATRRRGIPAYRTLVPNVPGDRYLFSSRIAPLGSECGAAWPALRGQESEGRPTTGRAQSHGRKASARDARIQAFESAWRKSTSP